MQGEYVRRAEIIFSANYFGFDDVVTSDGERISDRICAIPFQDLPDITPAEFASRQRKFKAVVDSEEKPVEFVIGEMGDYVLSEEFLAKRTEFSELLLEKCEHLIKIRTLLTNYASFYTITWKLFSIFEVVLREQVCCSMMQFLFLFLTMNFLGLYLGRDASLDGDSPRSFPDQAAPRKGTFWVEYQKIH